MHLFLVLWKRTNRLWCILTIPTRTGNYHAYFYSYEKNKVMMHFWHEVRVSLQVWCILEIPTRTSDVGAEGEVTAIYCDTLFLDTTCMSCEMRLLSLLFVCWIVLYFLVWWIVFYLCVELCIICLLNCVLFPCIVLYFPVFPCIFSYLLIFFCFVCWCWEK